MTNKIVLSIGSNSEDKVVQMQCCIEWLHVMLNNVRVSSVYSTSVLNGVDADYLNAVVIADVECEFADCKCLMKKYEASCGRNPESKFKGSIPIDIDIVIWNKDVVKPKDVAQSYFIKGWKELTIGK